MAASMMMAVFWVVEPCSLIEVYRRFKGAFCLHHQGDDEEALVNMEMKLRVPQTVKYFLTQ
jgi:hypothetical protein